MRVAYFAQWIEVEFGQRPEGGYCALSQEILEKKVKESSNCGGYPGGYYGPERPLRLYEVPFDVLEPEVKTKLLANPELCVRTTDDFWTPRFVGKTIYLKNGE